MKTCVAVLCCFLLASCARQTIQIQNEDASSIGVERMHHFFVGGIGQSANVNAAEICGGAEKVAMVETQQTFLDSVLFLVSYGGYAPRTLIIYCRK